MAFAFSPSAGCVIAVKINANYVTIPGAEGIPEFGAEKGVYEVTAIDDTAKKFGADLPDNGEMTLTGIWDSTDAAQAYLATSAKTPASVEDFQVTWAKKSGAATAATDQFNALVLSFKKSGAKGGPQKFSAKCKLTGAVNSVAAA